MGEPVFGRTAGEDGLTAWFQQTDRNHDGAITADEMTADADRFFQTLDTNHDGEIDPQEVTHYETAIAPEVRTGAILAAQPGPGAGPGPAPGGHGGHRGGGHGRHGGGGFGGGGFGGDDEARAGRFGLLTIPEPVASADADFNRGVSTREFEAAAAKRFHQLDLDQTGRLTLPELQGIRQAAISDARRPPARKPDSDDDSMPVPDDQPPM